MKFLRTLRIIVVGGLTSGLLACGGGGASTGGEPEPAASTPFNTFVLSTIAGGEDSDPQEVNDLTFDYADDDDAAFGAVLGQ